MKKYLFCFLLIFILTLQNLSAQDQSVAREWNEEILYAISADFARPTVHARNLYHLSIAMYDTWMAYEPDGNTYLLGKTVGTYTSPFDGIVIPENIEEAREEAISFAAYRLIEHRYAQSPGIIAISDSIQTLMSAKGYNTNNESTDYKNGGPAELGNYIASQVIAFGYTDGSNESGNYGNLFYEPLNPPIEVEEPGNPDIIDPNRWQQISLSVSIDQSGEIVESAPPFLSPEWGNVLPFSMTDEDMVIKSRDGHDYKIYMDPGEPALIDTTNPSGLESFYKWNFTLVPIWQSHLDTSDNVVWDISPNSVGNIESYPETQEEYESFYNFFDGGDPGQGYDINPVTSQPYAPQMIRRADYARVLAEFWADGPESVTPPGHWFKIYNEVSDHPLFERNWEGQGPELNALEYDVRAYFAIGGAMHDAAIAAWSIKGYYDYLRPVSAVRFMADKGQSTDSNLPNYHPAGIPLVPGFVELVEIGEPLAGLANQHAGKIKLYTWKGPDYIDDPENDESGVGWILAENWWPYQRPSFVTPPFAGYISGHSTYSRTAAEVMSLMTGSEFFPGGLSGFEIEQDEFLVFENGPSESFQLQWATYQDASDQCSLSRIWGGIHPPIDDIPGRKIGIELGPRCFNVANEIIQQSRPFVTNVEYSLSEIGQSSIGENFTITVTYNQEMDQGVLPELLFQNVEIESVLNPVNSSWNSPTEFEINYEILDTELENISGAFTIREAEGENGTLQNPYLDTENVLIDTKAPEVLNVVYSNAIVNDAAVNGGLFTAQIDFSEPCNTTIDPQVEFSADIELNNSLIFSELASNWINESSFLAVFDIVDQEIETENISLSVLSSEDLVGNQLVEYDDFSNLIFDTKNPVLLNGVVNNNVIGIQDIGTTTLIVNLEFDDEMDTTMSPELHFDGEDPSSSILQYNSAASNWISAFACEIHYNIQNTEVEMNDIVISLNNFSDVNGNFCESESISNLFVVDTKRPFVTLTNPETTIVSDQNVNTGFYIDIEFSENMDTDQAALVLLSGSDVASSLSNNFLDSEWLSENLFRAFFQVNDQNLVIDDITTSVEFALDLSGNSQDAYMAENLFSLDTENPEILSIASSDYFIEQTDIGSGSFEIIIIFQEPMNVTLNPELAFTPSNPVSQILSVNVEQSLWLNEYSFKFSMDVNNIEEFVPDVGIVLSGGSDVAGNIIEEIQFDDFLIIDTEPLSVNEMSTIEGLQVFPTILEGDQPLNIQSERSLTNYQFSVFSLTGKTLMQTSGSHLNSGINTIQINEYASGLYLYELKVDEGLARGKFFIP